MSWPPRRGPSYNTRIMCNAIRRTDRLGAVGGTELCVSGCGTETVATVR